MPDILAKRIKATREDHDDTQSALAEKLHVTWHTVASWEQGKSAPSYDLLMQFCRLYEVTSDYLLGLSDVDPLAEKRLRSRLTPENLASVHKYEQFLLWQQKTEKEPPKK